ncbi:MAG TPA: hypothetical protein VEJ42_00660 [Streptosporangiaceae bacterium]|nr:hypothetical protein [Streptosporangiaceae bacterium]
MSVSDAAPLPRLGEVFFDVRGNSRSMRLSWYADTGVAVFSIWQAGMCTGTFRLPMADLSRMIEILERGPAPQGRGRAPVATSRRGDERGSDSDWYYGPGGEEQAGRAAADPADGYPAGEYTAGYGRSQYEADYGRGERGPADYGAAGYGHPGQGHPGQGHPAGRSDADFGPAGYGAAGPAEYGGPDGGDERYRGGGYDAAGPGGDDDGTRDYPAGYERDEYAADSGYPGGYGPGGYGPGGYGVEADHLTGEHGGYRDDRWADAHPGYPSDGYDDRQDFRPGGHRYDGGFEGGVGGQPGAETDAGYGDERFVPRYAAEREEFYPNDNPASVSGYQGDMGAGGYPADRRGVSPADRYPEASAPADAYSYGADYRYR